jgi:peptidoglycan hydrolase-like protein with peptidoglycan-binding domain
MSRSKWACVESCRPVSVVALGPDHRARPEDRGRLGRAPLAGAVSSTKRLVGLMAASMLVMAAAPAAALAGSTGGSHPTPSSAEHSKQSLVHVARPGAAVLALGSGYSSRRDTVRVLQRRLTRAGYAPGPIDGRYGPRTEQAVTRFQAAHGLLLDGIAGPRTLAALSRSSAALYPGAGYPGHGSGAVRALQRRLTRAGYAPGPIDGRYGPRTEQAVMRFQAAHGLLVDGITGPQTIARLASERKPHNAARSSRPKNSRQRANRHARGGRSHPRPHTAPRRGAAPRTAVSPTRSTSSPSLALVVVLVALVAVGLCATWLAYRRHNKQYAEAQATRANGPDPADAAATKANHDATPNQTTTTRNRDLTRANYTEQAFNYALRREEQGDLATAAAIYRRADQLGDGAAACNLGVLLHEQGDWAAAEACFRRADQRGDPHGAFNLAVFLEEHGDQIEALRAYERVAQFGDPGMAEKAGAAAQELRLRIERSTAAPEGRWSR